MNLARDHILATDEESLVPGDDATPTYRGYRHQALYVLSRILAYADDTIVFQPEGQEDLAILDSAGQVIEAVQVKSRSEHLALSSFSPEKPDSFFHRAAGILSKNNAARVTIASFGPVGPELDEALRCDGPRRDAVRRKLVAHGLADGDVSRILERCDIALQSEVQLYDQIAAFLRESLLGGDPKHAFDLLQKWLYDASEHRERITAVTLRDRIHAVGRYLRERIEHHAQWFSTIKPVEERDISSARRDELTNGFYDGISARYEHILINVDVKRNRWLQRIRHAFQRRRIVIVHSASGQGKSTLGYRFLHDSVPSVWRYEITLIENRQHALDIATALSGHASAIGSPLFVYIDARPGDTAWTTLVHELEQLEHLRVLVTVREEDWRRASLTGVEFSFETIDLSLDETEGREIYSSLVSRSPAAQFLTFEEAWRGFGQRGPLLEFVHLVTRNESLRDRLKGQVRRLQDNVRTGQLHSAELDLLRTVAVATSFGGQIGIDGLASAFGIPELSRTLELLEKEYVFLQVSDDGRDVGGLHPIRSELLASLLTDGNNPTWGSVASACVPLLRELDVETFLLHAFSRRPDSTESLLEATEGIELQTWQGVAGVMRSLLWLGVRDYVRENEALIGEVRGRVGAAWMFLLDFDLTDVSRDVIDGFWERLGSPEADGVSKDFRARQSNKKDVYRYVSRYFASVRVPPREPQSDIDWIATAEVIFWVGYLKLDTPVRSWITSNQLTKVADTLTIDVVAEICLAASYSGIDDFDKWHASMHDKLLSRFQDETVTIGVEDDGEAIHAHYAYPVFGGDVDRVSEENDQTGNGNPLHAKSLRCVNLLRGLMPHRKRFGCHAYGHRMWYSEQNDSSEKLIAKENLPPQWAVRVNSVFIGLVDYQSRPENWPEYARSVFLLRQQALARVKQAYNAVREHYKTRGRVNVFEKVIEPDQWDKARFELKNGPTFPKCAVDEWGFAREAARKDDQAARKQNSARLVLRNLALVEHEALWQAYSEFTRTLGNFVDQVPMVVALNSNIGKQDTKAARDRMVATAEKQGMNTKLPRISVVNLAGAIQVLRSFQSVFRSRFKQFFDGTELRDLEREEAEMLTRTFDSWYQFSFHPAHARAKKKERQRGRHAQTVMNFQNALKRELKNSGSATLHAHLSENHPQWENKPALWIIVNSSDPVECMTCRDVVVSAVTKALEPSVATLLKHAACDLLCPTILIVPLVQGKSVSQTAWQVSVSGLLYGNVLESEGWWHYTLLGVPKEKWNELGLDVWENLPLENVATVFAAVSVLNTQLGHLNDFTRWPSHVDSLGRLQHYFEQVFDQLGPLTDETVQAISTLQDDMMQWSDSDFEAYPALVEIVDLMKTIVENVMPTAHFDGAVEMGIKEISAWFQRIDKAATASNLMFLQWISYELARRSISA